MIEPFLSVIIASTAITLAIALAIALWAWRPVTITERDDD